MSSMHTNAKRLIEIITGRKPADEISKTRNPSIQDSKGPEDRRIRNSTRG
jgi:hypothetical protein